MAIMFASISWANAGASVRSGFDRFFGNVVTGSGPVPGAGGLSIIFGFKKGIPF